MINQADLVLNNSVSERIKKAKVAFTTRRVDFNACRSLLEKAVPKVGDLVLARVEEIGQHARIELRDGRRARMFVGDEIVVVYGNRYAPDQFEAVIPDTLAPCHLVAAGGIAAQMLTKHQKMKTPTLINPVGLIIDKTGKPLNLSQFALKEIANIGSRPLTLAVAGTSMNAGKTTTAASLIKGLTAYGMKVGAAKITGTGAGGDIWFMIDSGADPVLDFVDAGFPSTYLIPFDRIENILDTLTSYLTRAGVDVIVLEIADGLYQEETAKLLSSKAMSQKVDGLLFTAGEAMGGRAGVEWLNRLDIPVLALSGALTSSPLAIREVENALDIPVLTKKCLTSPTIAGYLNEWFPSQEIENVPILKAIHFK
ncbi:MAG: DUF1611 domain-containing protein [Desulfosarcina sp.]|nr:DUF1611 domain-containing protein [Desulfosarcina sp.]